MLFLFVFFSLLFENHKLLMFIPISLLGIKLYKTVIRERRGKKIKHLVE